jgi:hypothetical protein
MRNILILLVISLIAFTAKSEKLTQCQTDSCITYFKKFQKSANRGHGQAMAMLGEFYYHGYGVKKDTKVALKYYKKAARKGITSAQYKAGLVYLINTNQRNIKKGLSYLTKAAAAEYKDASFLLGKIYLSDEFKVKNLTLADLYLAQSYRRKNPDVLATLLEIAPNYADLNSNLFPLLSKSIELAPPTVSNETLTWGNDDTEVITVTSMKTTTLFDLQLMKFRQPIKSLGSRLHGKTCKETVGCSSLDLQEFGDYIQ